MLPILLLSGRRGGVGGGGGAEPISALWVKVVYQLEQVTSFSAEEDKQVLAVTPVAQFPVHLPFFTMGGATRNRTDTGRTCKIQFQQVTYFLV